MPRNIPKGSMRVPSLSGGSGVPASMPRHSLPKGGGLVSPTTAGMRGKPEKKPFPGRRAPLD